MAQGTVYILEGVNLFAGDHDPSKSLHLVLEEWKLPTMQRTFAGYQPGGAPVGVEWSVGVEKLESSFKLNGFAPDVIAQFGYGSRQSRRYTGYGAYRDKRAGTVVEARAVIEAQLGKFEADAAKRGEVQGHDFQLNEITHYELYFDNRELFFFDFWTSTWRVNGQDDAADVNSVLRIGGA